MKTLNDVNKYPELKHLISNVVSEINNYTSHQLNHIEKLKEIGIALSTEQDLNVIFDMILEEAISYTNADGATIYTVSEDKRCLDFQIVYNRTLNTRMGGTHGKITWNSLPLYDRNGKPRMNHMATYVVHTGEPQFIDDVYKQNYFDNQGTKEIDLKNNYRTKSMMTIPLKDHENEVLGIIQLLNAMDEEGNVISFSDHHMTMLSSLASQTAITFTNRRLIKDLEKLLFQFIKAIADAIDRKSEYTGGHVQRVAKLTNELALKINNCDHGIYKNIQFSYDELEEIKISGWLHDIGKIITPVHVMDKSKKLEKIFDRIELVKTRFELVNMVIEKDILQAKIDNDLDKIEQLEQLKTKLKDDFVFLEKCNTGGEFMRDEDLNRIDKIFEFSYSQNGKRYFLITENEKENLKIRRGTLLGDEIKKIQEHALVSLEMLNKLSFPKKYKNVPTYAASHHEKLNGKGYPRNLKAEQLPLQARMIAISDMFEALTASDRPYKKGKPLSEALRILAFQAKDNDIDGHLLDLFIDSKLYLEYAKQHLPEHQIDEVDIDKIKEIYNGEKVI